MLVEFCDWCREHIVNRNLDCKFCESCLRCQYFDRGFCLNEIVLTEYRNEWRRPKYVLGLGPPLCRAYCPYLPDDDKSRAFLLSQGEDKNKDESRETKNSCEGTGNGRGHKIVFTPLPKFWLNDDFECITFEVDFNETIYYHMVLLGWCEWEIPDRMTLEIPADI